MHRTQVIKKLKKLEQHYKPLFNRIYYNVHSHKSSYSGQYNVSTKNITIALINDERDIIQTFFHELGHGYCIKNGLWKSYHIKYINNESERDKYIRTGLKAERWVDRWAEQEMKKYFPNLKYKPYYSEDVWVKWFKTTVLDYARQRVTNTIKDVEIE